MLLRDQLFGGSVGGEAGQSEGPTMMDSSLADLLVLTLLFRNRVSVDSSGSELIGGGSVTPEKMTLTPRLEEGSSSQAWTACVMSSWMMNSSSLSSSPVMSVVSSVSRKMSSPVDIL